MLADETGHILIIGRPGPKGELEVIEIGQQRIMGQASAKLLKTGLIVGPHGIIGLAIQTLILGLGHDPWRKQCR